MAAAAATAEIEEGVGEAVGTVGQLAGQAYREHLVMVT